MVDTHENWYALGCISGEIDACIIMNKLACDPSISSDQAHILGVAIRMIQDDYGRKRKELHE